MWELDLSDGREAVVTYAFGPRVPAEIRVLDHRGEPVSGAQVYTFAGARHLGWTDRDGRTGPLPQAPLGVVRLRVEHGTLSPQVTAPVDLSEPAVLRLLPTGRAAVTVLRDGERVRGGRVRVHTEVGVVGSWTKADASGRTTIPYEIPVGVRRVEFRPEGGMPRFADVEIVEGRTAEVEIRLP